MLSWETEAKRCERGVGKAMTFGRGECPSSPRPPTKTPEQYREAHRKLYVQQALGEWLIEQKELGRETVPIQEIDLVLEGIVLGVKFAEGGG
jgi:hypothetical protein